MTDDELWEKWVFPDDLTYKESVLKLCHAAEREAYRRAAAECRAIAVDFRRTGNQCTYTWKADGAEDCAEAIEALGREE